MYSDVSLLIDGGWRPAVSGKTLAVLNPATGDPIGNVAHAEKTDLDLALAAAQKGFEVWRKVSAFERYKVMRKAADNLRARADEVATQMTMEQGKPRGEAKMETLAGADIIDWFAEEGRRTYGRTIPARVEGVYQLELKEPVGPVAAFTPWNFPINQAVRKISGAVATGCSIIIKGPEETPASCAALVDAFVKAGLPAGVINLVFGVPGEISSYLIPHPVIRKISFTGSTAVGKHLAMLAGQHMKRVTMELGGHAPAIVFSDADIDAAAKTLSAAKFRNAGQVIAIVGTFDQFDDAIAEANRLSYGLAAYAYTRSTKTAAALGHAIESGMVTINHLGLALPEVPFGGVKDSGYGTEGGADALEAYLNTKFVTQMNA
jgi:succinate-semialdehyde dehydrogenase/glutarate-semialdehyde dehydrogenase